MQRTDLVTIHDFYIENNFRVHEIEVGFKYPRIDGWQKLRKPIDEVQLALSHPSYNKYGVVLEDWHILLDIDIHNPEADGYASKAKLESACGVDISAVCGATTTTPSGGCHYLFRKPDWCDFEFSRTYTAYPGLDFLDGARAKQVIGANSFHDFHPGRYEFVQAKPTLVDLPMEIVRHLETLSRRAQEHRTLYDPFRDPLVGDGFMRAWDGVELLKEEMEQRGYVFRMCDDYYEYDRPGKTTNSERSGYLGKQSEFGNYQLTSFSLSDPHFPSGVSITIFHAYSHLCCDGDDTEAARRLSSKFAAKNRAEDVFERVVAGEKVRVDSSSLPKIVSIRETLKANPVERPVLIQDTLRLGEVMNIIASPKVGKSWLLNQLLLAIACGGDWIGKNCISGRVLLVDNELHRETHAGRLRASRNALPYPNGMADENFDVLYLRGQQRDIYGLAEIFMNIPKGYYSLVALDAMYRCWPKGLSENSNADVTAFYNAVDGYAKLLDASFALVHHTSKGDQSDRAVTDVGSGAGSIARAVDTHVTIRPHEQENHAVLDMVCRSFRHPEPRSIEFDFPIWKPAESVQPRLANPQRQAMERRDADLAAAILGFVTDNPGCTARQIRNHTNAGAERVNRVIDQLLDAEDIIESGSQANRNGTVSPTYSRLQRHPPNDGGMAEFLA